MLHAISQTAGAGAKLRQAMLRRAAMLLCIFAVAACTSTSEYLSVDDGYTVGQRYKKNKPNYPEIEWVSLEFERGYGVEFDRPYKSVDTRDLHLDIFTPTESKRNGKAAILVHGGGWQSGNKSHMYVLANKLTQKGYTVLVPEYRLAVEAPYPAGLVDINSAIVWAKEHSETYGFSGDDIVLVGGSSGGQMVALNAHSADEPLFQAGSETDTSVAAVVDLDGVLDFTTPTALKYENWSKGKSGAGLWFGGSYEKKQSVWEEASAVNHIDAASPPTLIMSSGHLRFTAGREEVQEKLDALGIPNEYFEYEGMFHTFWLFDPYVSEVADRIDGFVQSLTTPETTEQ